MTLADPAHDSVLVVVARVEGRMETFQAETRGKLDNLTERWSGTGMQIEELERRVGNLESWRNRLAGAVAVVVVILTAALYFVINHGHISIQA